MISILDVMNMQKNKMDYNMLYLQNILFLLIHYESIRPGENW